MPASVCATPFDAFRMATESLPNELYRRASYKDIWLNVIPRSTYSMGTGLVQSTFTIGRSEPTSDEETWTPITLSTNGSYTGACGVTYNAVDVGFDEATYSPETFGLSGPVICQDDLIFNFRAEAFLEAYIQQMQKRNTRSVTNRLHVKYRELVPKTVATTTYSTFQQAWTGGILPQATCQLDQTMLDQTAIELNESGASDPDSSGWINLGEDGPVYPIYIGQAMSQQLDLANADIRQDYRYADPSMLLKRVGATRVIRNFRHVINLFPPRYTYAGGTYTRVNTWLMPAGTKGKKAIINPSWESAPYEAAIVLNPWVMTEEIVKPVNSAAGLSWMPKNYFGEWQFITGGREITDPATGDCFDPTKKLGRHFAEYKHAIKPIFPEYGRYIIFKRCPTASFPCVTCT
jgi:hypothetical protein